MRGRLAPLTLAAVLAAPATAAISGPRKQLVVACNAFADERPVSVGVRVVRVKQQSKLKRLRRKSVVKTNEVLWTRELPFGSCEEYHVDLEDDRRLFFNSPGDEGSDRPHCELHMLQDYNEVAGAKHGEQKSTRSPEIPSRLAVAVTQPQVSSRRCAVQAAALFEGRLRPTASSKEHPAQKPALFALLDAYSRVSAREDPTQQWVSELAAEDQKLGLTPLPPLESGVATVVVRMEDKIEPEMITSEVIGSRTLGLSHVYTVEPKEFHIILEDLRGTHSFNWQDVSFESAHVYVGIRVGRAGDKSFPQRLLIHRCEERPLEL